MPVKIPISVLVQTKNEEVAIEACVRALDDFDQVIVVDSDSTDRTKEIAVAAGAEVVNFTWNGYYPKKKQWQLDNLPTKHGWVLLIDADEQPSSELVAELRRLTSGSGLSGSAYDILLDYHFAGRRLSHGHRVLKRVLLRRDQVRFPVIDDLDLRGMGELEGHYQPTTDDPPRRLKGRILHDDPDPVRSWFDRHNKYSDWESGLRAQQQVDTVRANRSRQGRLFDAIPGKPAMFFLYAYVLRGGLLDGRAGFDYAVALSFYYWQIGVKERELVRLQGEAREDGGR